LNLKITIELVHEKHERNEIKKFQGMRSVLKRQQLGEWMFTHISFCNFVTFVFFVDSNFCFRDKQIAVGGLLFFPNEHPGNR